MLKALLVLLLPALLRANPQVLSFMPPSGAVDVSRSAPLEILFDQPVVGGAASVLIYNNDTESLIEAFPAAGLPIDGGHVTITPSAPLPFGVHCFVSLYECFHDGSGNYFNSDEQLWSFTVMDFIIHTFDPPQHAVGVDVDSALHCCFNQSVAAGPGVVEIRRLSDQSLFESFSAAQLMIADSLVEIDPSGPFEFNVWYYVTISADAFHDGEGGAFPGFESPDVWSFATEGFQPVTFSPADGSVDVPVDAELELTFNGDVVAGPGSLRLRCLTDGAPVETFPASQLAFSGSQATIQPAQPFDLETGYYVEIDSDAFVALAGGGYAGISGPAAWNFSTLARFTDLQAGLPGLSSSAVDWGDYDNDGDLDVLMGGHLGGGAYTTRIYRNDNSQFTDIGAGLVGIASGSVAWGDGDGDGDLDVLLAGGASGIYRNDEGLFTDIGAGLPGFSLPSLAWGDYDNDGDLDILAAGEVAGQGSETSIIRNENGVFTPMLMGLTGVMDGIATWGDFENDGDLDILVAGNSGSIYTPIRTAIIYRNTVGQFQYFNLTMYGCTSCSAAWGDYNSDGWLDFVLDGYTSNGPSTRVYRNTGGNFTEFAANVIGAYEGSLAWGDYDSDGALDLLVTGRAPNPLVLTRVYRNTGSGFNLMSELTGLFYECTTRGDFDQDGDLDILISGLISDSNRITRIYRNNSRHANAAPQPPTALSIAGSGSELTFDWSAGSDAETPTAGLSYNLEIGLLGAPRLVKSGMADGSTGLRRLPALGNVNQVRHWTLRLPFLAEPPLPQETRIVVAGVQAIDHTWAGSVFAWDTLALTTSTEYLALHNSSMMRAGDLLSWDLCHAEALAGFEIQLAANSGFDPLLGETWLDVSVGARDLLASTTLSGLVGFETLEADHAYYWRVRPVYTDTRRATVFSATPGSFTLVATPPAPQHLQVTVSGEAVQLSWDAVPGDLVGYVVYSATDAYAPFPAGWQEQAPTFQTSWTDPQAAMARRFYRVKAVVLE